MRTHWEMTRWSVGILLTVVVALAVVGGCALLGLMPSRGDGLVMAANAGAAVLSVWFCQTRYPARSPLRTFLLVVPFLFVALAVARFACVSLRIEGSSLSGVAFSVANYAGSRLATTRARA